MRLFSHTKNTSIKFITDFYDLERCFLSSHSQGSSPIFSKMSSFMENPCFYIIDKRATSAKIAGSPCFTIIDLLDVKPPKIAATTTQIKQKN